MRQEGKDQKTQGAEHLDDETSSLLEERGAHRSRAAEKNFQVQDELPQPRKPALVSRVSWRQTGWRFTATCSARTNRLHTLKVQAARMHAA